MAVDDHHGRERRAVITLFPGDVVNSGTTGGTSSGAFKQGTRKGYLKPGETIEAAIEGIGTLRHPVVAGKPLPIDLTGAQLPAVRTYARNSKRHLTYAYVSLRTRRAVVASVRISTRRST